MKVSIIGSGWLAKPLALSLLTGGKEVCVSSTQTEKVNTLIQKGIPCIKYSLGESIEKHFNFFNTDLLIIAITSKDIDAFRRLMSQINPLKTKHIIFISSTSVYATCEIPHDEESINLIEESKLLTIEKLIQKHPKVAIIRFAGLVGPKRHPGRFFANNKIIKNPKASVNLIHLDDCIGIINAIIEQNAWSEIFNACADNHPEKGEYYQVMAESLRLVIPMLEATNYNAPNKIISNLKIKKHLNYQLIYPDVFKMVF